MRLKRLNYEFIIVFILKYFDSFHFFGSAFGFDNFVKFLLIFKRRFIQASQKNLNTFWV